MRAAPIDEIVGLLNRNAPSQLEELRQKYPKQVDLLSVGKVAGALDQNLGVRIDTALAGLGVARGVCKRCIVNVRKKLRFADRAQFSGQLATIIAGASIFGVLAVDVPNLARYSAAALALVGSILTVIAQHKLKGFGGAENNIFNSYSALVDCQIDADSTLRELEIHKQTGDADKVNDLIVQANLLSSKITRLESLVGV